MKKWVAILAASSLLLSAGALAKSALKVNLNTATVKQLTAMKGIGPKRAAAIVAFRKQHGRFKSIKELTAIRGISEKSLARLEKKNASRLVLK